MPQLPLRTMRIRLLEALVLLRALQDANANPNLARADADRTIEDLYKALDKSVQIDKRVLESALWSANMQNELGKFWHPNGINFKTFITRMFRGDRGDYFNTEYNLIMEKKTDEKDN